MLRKFVCQLKSDPFVELVKVISVTPNFASICFPDSFQSMVLTEELAPMLATDPSITNLDPPHFTDFSESLSPTQMDNDESRLSTDQQESSEDINIANDEVSTPISAPGLWDSNQQLRSERDIFFIFP